MRTIPYEDLLDVADETQHRHSGMDAIYALTSSVMAGRDVPLDVAERALSILERDERAVNTPAGQERYGLTDQQVDSFNEAVERLRYMVDLAQRKEDFTEGRRPTVFENPLPVSTTWLTWGTAALVLAGIAWWMTRPPAAAPAAATPTPGGHGTPQLPAIAPVKLPASASSGSWVELGPNDSMDVAGTYLISGPPVIGMTFAQFQGAEAWLRTWNTGGVPAGWPASDRDPAKWRAEIDYGGPTDPVAAPQTPHQLMTDFPGVRVWRWTSATS